MTIDEYRRGIPNYKGENGQTVGMLCETKEQCITDDDGVSLPDKLAGLKKYTDDAYANSNLYTDTKIGELINGAPTTLDTLKEIADAMEENADVVEALDAAVGSKVDQAEYDGHADNSTIHITAAEREAWNNNSSEGVQAIIDGTTPAGNANKLDGKSASELKAEYSQGHSILFKSFTTQAEFENYVNTYSANLPADSAYEINVMIGFTGYELEPCQWYIEGIKINNDIEIQTAKAYHSAKCTEKARVKFGADWKAWVQTATTADLANYLPKSGGTVTTDANNNLPQLIFTLKNGVNGDGAFLRFDDAVHGFLGFLGFENRHTPIFSDDNGNPHPLLHTGNVGNYTAGSAYALTGSYSSDNGGILYNPNYGGVRYTYNVTSDTPGIFPNFTNANSVLTLNRHAGDYTSQLGFSSNGCLYYRAFEGEAMYASKAWREILHTGTSAKCVVVDTDPGVGASVSYADGTLIFVKE